MERRDRGHLAVLQVVLGLGAMTASLACGSAPELADASAPVAAASTNVGTDDENSPMSTTSLSGFFGDQQATESAAPQDAVPAPTPPQATPTEAAPPASQTPPEVAPTATPRETASEPAATTDDAAQTSPAETGRSSEAAITLTPSVIAAPGPQVVTITGTGLGPAERVLAVACSLGGPAFAQDDSFAAITDRASELSVLDACDLAAAVNPTTAASGALDTAIEVDVDATTIVLVGPPDGSWSVFAPLYLEPNANEANKEESDQ